MADQTSFPRFRLIHSLWRRLTRDFPRFQSTRTERQSISVLGTSDCLWLKGYERALRQVNEQKGRCAAQMALADLAEILGVGKEVVRRYFERLGKEKPRKTCKKEKRNLRKRSEKTEFSFIVDMKSANSPSEGNAPDPLSSTTESLSVANEDQGKLPSLDWTHVPLHSMYSPSDFTSRYSLSQVLVPNLDGTPTVVFTETRTVPTFPMNWTFTPTNEIRTQASYPDLRMCRCED